MSLYMADNHSGTIKRTLIFPISEGKRKETHTSSAEVNYFSNRNRKDPIFSLRKVAINPKFHIISLNNKQGSNTTIRGVELNCGNRKEGKNKAKRGIVTSN